MADKMVRMPSFPQRGQADSTPILELPDDAPQILRSWISRMRFTKEYVRYFGLIQPAIEELWNIILIVQPPGPDSGDEITAEAQLSVSSERRHVEPETLLTRAAGRIADLALSDALAAAQPVGRSAGISTVFSTWAGRSVYSAKQFKTGSFLVITDHPLVYVNINGAWTYRAGYFRADYADFVADIGALTANDAGLLVDVTDYGHTLLWSGSAFGWGPSDEGSGRYGFFETAPTSAGWQICDGSTVDRLNADGTTTPVTVPDVTTPRVIVGGLAAAAVAAASGNTGTPSATTQVDNDLAVSTVLVGSATHTHGPGNVLPANKQAIMYYRR